MPTHARPERFGWEAGALDYRPCLDAGAQAPAEPEPDEPEEEEEDGPEDDERPRR
jgi:hypothetical protein